MTRARGLTLVEMLVAILLLGFASALVVQGIGQGLALLRRVAADQGEAYHELMARSWLHQTIAAAAVSASGAVGFEGDARGVRLNTFRPLLGPEGIAAAIAWEASGTAALDYAEGDQRFTVLALPELQRIEYLGTDGTWSASWPIEDGESLPARVRFVFAGDDRLDVGIQTQRTPVARAGDLSIDED